MAARLAELESRKAAAVAGEDYDSAKGVKAEIDRVRTAAGAPAAGQTASSPWLQRHAQCMSSAQWRAASAGPTCAQNVGGLDGHAT